MNKLSIEDVQALNDAHGGFLIFQNFVNDRIKLLDSKIDMPPSDIKTFIEREQALGARRELRGLFTCFSNIIANNE